MIRYSTFLVAVALVTVALAAGEEKKFDMEPPEHLDKKGFFVLPHNTVRELKVKSITTSVWRYEEDGTLMDTSYEGPHAEYDMSGRVIGFAGHVDQGGYMDLEYQYDDEGRVLEQRAFSNEGGVRVLAVRAVFDYSKPEAEERVMYDSDGAVVSRARYLLDDAGRVLKTELLDPDSGRVLAEATREYDNKGNFVEERGEAGRTVHSLENNVLTVSSYFGPAGSISEDMLYSVGEYTFDDEGNLLSFFRQLGDGSFWDRFTYKLDERGLPVEEIWSRFEYFLQDPYKLTKYSYEYYQ